MSDTDRQSSPVVWPDGQTRTRIQDRKRQAAWKKPMLGYRLGLEKELQRIGATDWLITYNRAGDLDPSVAVYFSRTPINQFAWQEALGLIGRVPSVEEINKAYRNSVKPYHPEGATPDLAMFHSLTTHRDRALDWALGRHRRDHEYVIPLDVFNETRLNLNAVRLTLAAMRQIERCGAPLMLERAFRGFHKSLVAGVGSGTGDTEVNNGVTSA